MTVDPSTSMSLLLRLQDAKNPKAQEDWERFVTLYTPLLFMWARQRKLQDSDASDLVQNVFLKIHSALPRMQLDPSKRFRGYLFITLVNAYRDLLSSRQRQPLSGVELEEEVSAAKSDIELFEEKRFREYVLARAFEVVDHMLNEKHREIFRRLHTTEETPAQIAEDMEIPVEQVYVANSRAKKKIREELGDFCE